LVTAILPFGVFVEINVEEPFVKTQDKPKETKEKIEGLVHISEISWEKIDEPAKMFVVGQEVEVIVIAKDLETGRLNLSLKQLQQDPFIEASARYAKDQKVHGTVSKVTPFGVFVTLEDPANKLGVGAIEGLVHISKIPPNVSYTPGTEVDCEIESVDTAAHRISLVPIAKEKPILYR
jgi:small subunit ribosomal protein S1